MLFESLRRHDRGHPAAAVLCQVMGVTLADWRVVLARLDALSDDAVDAVDRLTDLDDPSGNVQTDYIRPIPDVIRVYTQNTGAPLAMLTDPISAEAVHAMRTASALLGARWRDPVLKENTIAELKLHLDAMIEQVQEATDLTREDKAWLIDQLGRLILAVNAYEVLGYAAFERATNEFMGGLGLRPDRPLRLGKTQIASALMAIVSLLGTTVQTAAAYDQLSGPSMTDVMTFIEHQLEAGTSQRMVPALPATPQQDADTLDADQPGQ